MFFLWECEHPAESRRCAASLELVELHAVWALVHFGSPFATSLRPLSGLLKLGTRAVSRRTAGYDRQGWSAGGEPALHPLWSRLGVD